MITECREVAAIDNGRGALPLVTEFVVCTWSGDAAEVNPNVDPGSTGLREYVFIFQLLAAKLRRS